MGMIEKSNRIYRF